jgi:signal peptide peptidase SppA
MKKKENLKKQKAQPERALMAKLKKLLRPLLRRPCTVAVLRMEGAIGGRSGFKSNISLESVNKKLEEAFKTPRIKAIALVINSPGGSPVQSELIYNRIKQLSKESAIPVYVFIEDVAASGGYWLACAGDEIYSAANSIIGSIGVLYSGFGFDKVIKKAGIDRRVYTEGSSKALLDPFMPERKEDIKIIKSVQKDIHENFKELVKKSRNNKLKKVDIFTGEIWSANKALSLGLIDDVGDLYSVMSKKFGSDISYKYVSEEKSWIKRKLGVILENGFESLISAAANKLAGTSSSENFHLK